MNNTHTLQALDSILFSFPGIVLDQQMGTTVWGGIEGTKHNVPFLIAAMWIYKQCHRR